MTKTENFINKANIIHNNKFIYDKTIYVKSNNKVIITCPIHGDFTQTPNHHLRGIGCSKCSNCYKPTLNEVIKKANAIHKNKYDYSLFIHYRSKASIIEIICPIHGKFKQRVDNHLSGSGCPNCNGYGFTRTRWINYCENNSNSEPQLYIIKCFNNNETFIKIGITARNIYNRFSTKIKMPYDYIVLKQILGSPELIYNLEKKLHKIIKPFKYKPSIHFNGERECFSVDSLNELTEYI